MRVSALILFLASALLAQDKLEIKTFEGFKGKTEPIFKPVHVHVRPPGGTCTGEADGVYSKISHTYYACVHGHDVCSDDKDAIPYRLTHAFDQHQAAARSDVRRAQFIERLGADGGEREIATPMAKNADREAPRIADERLAEISVGVNRDEVLRKLGTPNSTIRGDSERFTYLLMSGANARIRIEDGRVVEIRTVLSK